LILIDRYAPLLENTATAAPFPPANYAKRSETDVSDANKK
jgi:hypothetical protein